MAFIIRTNLICDPATCSATAQLASLPEATAMPYNNLSRVRVSPARSPMREPPSLAAARLTVTLSLSATRLART